MKRTPFTKTRSVELVAVRVSLARVCQVAGVQTDDLPIQDDPFEVLCERAKRYERGWNTLANELLGRIEQMKLAGDAMASQLELVAKDLKETTPQESTAWKDMIEATERQAKLGRQYFPESQVQP